MHYGVIMSKKKKNKQEELYEITPRGWIYLIALQIQRGDYDNALQTCDEFDKWCEKHIVYKEKE